MAQELLSIGFRNVSNRPLRRYAVTYGVPLPQAALRESRDLAIRLENGQLVPLQTRVLERHFDGSVKWLLLDFAMPLGPNEEVKASLVHGQTPVPDEQVLLQQDDEHILVTTPRLSASIGKKRFSLFESLTVNGKEMVEPGSDMVVEGLSGKRFRASASKDLDVQVVESGRQRVVVQVTGRHTAGDGSEMLTFRVRYEFRPHEPGVKVSYKFTNAEPPETGVHLGSIRIILPTTLGQQTTRHIRQCNHGRHWFSRIVAVAENAEIVASKAQNEAAKARYGSVADGKIVVRDLAALQENLSEYPYFLRPGNARTDMTGGLRQVYPYMAVNGEGGSVVAWFFEMSQNFPKGILSDCNALAFDVWPAWAGEFHLRRGMSKEHDLFVSFADHSRTPEQMEAVYFDHEVTGIGVLGVGASPVQITLDADYIRSAEALQLHRWLRYDEGRYLLVESKLGSLGKRTGGPGQLGMLDYGDHVSADRSWSHNNENDAILDGIRGYYRKEDPGALAGALAGARHNAHVDFIAYDPDPLRQGTMPAHCPEHTDGATYPSHMWLDGLMAAYCVSGNPDFREAALSVGENMLRWQKDDPTLFYADSRECGWPMLAFLRLHEHTGEQRWLDACRETFQFYRDKVNQDGDIVYELPHGLGLYLGGYGEFIGWRACFFYYERTRDEQVKEFLVQVLDKRYLRTPSRLAAGGWACNDLFPAWAAYMLTGDDKYIEDNYPFLRLLMKQQGDFPWGGVDMHFYLNELDRRGVLEAFQQ